MQQLLEPINDNQLLATEAADLARHEEVIARGITGVFEAGSSLMAIRDARLYRATHDTFEAYCRDRWNMSRPRAYQFIDAANITANLSTGVDKTPLPLPTMEAQVRPLAPLPPEDQRTVWAQAVEESGGDQPTAVTVRELSKLVRDRREEREREVAITPAEPAPVTPKPVDDPPPMSRKELRELREKEREKEKEAVKRGRKQAAIIEAIETLSDPAPLTVAEVAAYIIEVMDIDDPDNPVDWITNSDDALSNLQILVKELHK